MEYKSAASAGFVKTTQQKYIIVRKIKNLLLFYLKTGKIFHRVKQKPFEIMQNGEKTFGIFTKNGRLFWLDKNG